jgi:hypothetical protein
MTYTLGAEGPERRDTVLFEGGVLFVHRTGREMVDLEQMLPELAMAPHLLDSLESRSATLDCGRLECWFAMKEGDVSGGRGGALTRAPARLASLTASQGVYLRDQEGSRVREVNADWLEFNRELTRIDVRGTEQADARIYFQDLETNDFAFQHGRWLVINLKDGTIQANDLTGEVYRP